MVKLIKSIGHGLLAAGAFMIVLYFGALYVKGHDALRDALDPLASRNFLVLLPLVPGAMLLWLGGYIAARRRPHPPPEISPQGASRSQRY